MDHEEQLLERARSHDQAALGEIYDRYAPRIYRYLYRQVGSAQLPVALTSDVFVSMLGALRARRYRKGAFRSWLYRIAHNRAVDHYRAKRPELIADVSPGGNGDSPGKSPGDATLGSQQTVRNMDEALLSRQGLDDALGQLTVDQRQVLTLRFGEGLSARETAQVVKKSVGAVEALQRRALAAMRKQLGDEEP